MNKFSPFSIKRAAFLNIAVNPLSISQLNDFIAQVCATNRRGSIIANHNLHSVYLSHRDEAMASFYSLADRTHIDGMGVVLLGRLCGVPLQRSMRVTYVDWLPQLLGRAAQEGWRVFYLGSRPGVAEVGAQRFRRMFPDLKISSHHGYFDTATDSGRIIDLIQAAQPNVLLVGMGMPRQEKWIAENYHRLSANVILTAGAAIDYFANAAVAPPRWMGRLGLEWTCRLVAEPARLWRRYLVEPWSLLRLLVQERGSAQIDFAERL